MPSGVPNTQGSKYVGRVGSIPGNVNPVVMRFTADNHYNLALTTTAAKEDTRGLRNSALIAVRNKLKSTDVNLGVAFAERKQTTRLLTDTALRLAKSIKNLKRGNVRKAMDDLGISSKRREPRGSNVPKKWLEMQYAWKPWLADVYGSCDALNKAPPDHWRVTAKATRRHTAEYTAGITPNATCSNGFDACRVVSRLEQSVFARIDAEPENELLISLASLGILNPLLVVWERVPFSFLIDWAWPIGSWLESLDALVGYKCLGYSSSMLVRAEWVDTGFSKTATSGQAKIVNDYVGVKRLVYLKREVSTSTPIPVIPRFKDPRSLGHMANALALLAGAVGKHRS